MAGSGTRCCSPKRQRDLPAAAVPRLCLPRDPDGDGGLGRACGLSRRRRAIAARGVFDNFWKLVERWKVTFIITVPTAIAALMQRPVDADISSVKTAFSGSAPLPVELFTGSRRPPASMVEGYGLTEATCLVSCNPVDGRKEDRLGRHSLSPYARSRSSNRPDGPGRCGSTRSARSASTIPASSKGSTYTESDKNIDLFHGDSTCAPAIWAGSTPDGYLWITGRAKDLIIRGGHNIDPAEIEEALAGPRGGGLCRRDRPARRLRRRIALRLCRTGRGATVDTEAT
jgi:acyl-CoA synthetase (AMP-forming)/AMP-acid ligase II